MKKERKVHIVIRNGVVIHVCEIIKGEEPKEIAYTVEYEPEYEQVD